MGKEHNPTSLTSHAAEAGGEISTSTQFDVSTDGQKNLDINKQDKKKAQDALHDGLRPDDVAKGHQQGGSHAAQT